MSDAPETPPTNTHQLSESALQIYHALVGCFPASADTDAALQATSALLWEIGKLADFSGKLAYSDDRDRLVITFSRKGKPQ